MPSQSNDTERYKRNLQDEIDSLTLYRAVAAKESDERIRGIFLRMADTEQKHANFWAEQLSKAGETPKSLSPTWRTRSLVWLLNRFGPGFVLPTLADRETRAQGDYDEQPETQGLGLRSDERSHARLLQQLAASATSTRRGTSGSVIAMFEGRHKTIGGNALRAAVLGANDGLVSNLSLVMGVAGAVVNAQVILITGLAGLLAGAFSMAMGEWISVQSSRELVERQLRLERDELEAFPEGEAEELRQIYEAKGLSPEDAEKVVQSIMQNQELAMDTLAREELGIDPEEAGGSPNQAAFSSFLLFVAGAIVPVAPFIFLNRPEQSTTAIIASIICSAVALFVVGAGITLMTGRGVLFSGTRQLLFGLGAAAVTFSVGRLIGVSVAG